MNELIEQLLSHAKAIWGYRWYAVVIAWIIAVGGWIYVYYMPDQYKASTRVHVDTQSVLRPLLQGIAVQPDLDQVVAMMSRTLISRPNIEKVIQMTSLDFGLATNDDRNSLVSHLAKNLSMTSAGEQNLYTISFVDQNPQVAKRVVESFLQLFMERSLGDKRQDADSARRFIDEQLEGYRETLTASENAIMEFKRGHLGLLPGEGSSYFARLDGLKITLRKAELELKEAENSADSIRKQLAIAARNASLRNEKNVGDAVEPETEIDIRIRDFERRLDDLRLSYTEQHPDIVAMLPMIAKLRERKEAERLREQEEEQARLSGGIPSATLIRDKVYQELTVALTTAEANVAVMKTRVAEFRRRFAELAAVADSVPQVEAEYTQLTRDYNVNRARYNELLKRRETAVISGDVEESDAAMGFRVIDPPRVPRAPSGPTAIMKVTIVLLAALGGGLGAAWLFGQMKPTINDERRLKEVSGLNVLGTVVMAWTDAQKKRRKWGLVAFFTSFASLLSAYGAIMAALILTVSRS
jgi:polysaccharide chain length determinant protein (PEP-CTERM system associated)